MLENLTAYQIEQLRKELQAYDAAKACTKGKRAYEFDATERKMYAWRHGRGFAKHIKENYINGDRPFERGEMDSTIGIEDAEYIACYVRRHGITTEE